MRGIGAQTVAAPRVSAPVRRDVAAVRGRGRFGDTQLAHLSPKSDAFLKKMGGSGTRNPDTGLKEHFSFKDLLPILAPVALNILAPGIGSSIGEGIGLSGAAANLVGSGLTGAGIGALTGGGRGALIGGLTGAGLAGFNEMGGFKGIGESLGIGGGAAPAAVGEAAQPDARGLDMLKTEVVPTLASPEAGAPLQAPPSLAAIAGPAGIESAPLPPPPSASTQGAAGVPAGTTADKLSGTGLGKAALLGGAMLLLGGAPKPAQGETVDEEIQRLDNSFGGPLPKYELDREMTPLTDEELRTFGQSGTAPKPKGTGIFYDAPNRYKFKNFAEGGEVAAAKRLEAKGRGGDTILAHINPHEAALLKARGGSGTVNPETGLLEFYDSEPGEGSAGSGTTGGGDYGGGDYSGGSGDYGYGMDTPTPADPQSPGGKDEGVRAGAAEPAAAPGAGPFGAPTGWTHGYTPTTVDLFKNDERFMGNLNLLGNKAIHKVADMVNNPIATVINGVAAGLGLGVPNMLAGALTGWDAGKALTAAGRAIGEAAGKPGATPTGTEFAGTESQSANGIGQFSRGEGGFYIPGPTSGVGEAPAPTGALNTRYARNLTVPSDAELRAFGQGGGGRQAGMFYDVPNMQQFKDGGEVMDGRSDDVPAMLSHGEHVVDAETVSLLGNGSNDAGHARLEKMKSDIRKRKGKALAKGKISPNAKLPKVA